jgi:hypothetical protein
MAIALSVHRFSPPSSRDKARGAGAKRGTPAPLAPEFKVQGLQTPTVGYAPCCALADRPSGPYNRSLAGGKGRSFCSSRLKTSGPFPLVFRDARTGPP